MTQTEKRNNETNIYRVRKDKIGRASCRERV